MENVRDHVQGPRHKPIHDTASKHHPNGIARPAKRTRINHEQDFHKDIERRNPQHKNAHRASRSKNSKRTPQTTIIKVGANEMGKLPPQAPELEDSVLGAIMLEKDAFGSVADLLRSEVFYKDQNRYIYEAIRTLSAKDLPIDVMTVGEMLKTQGTLEKAGGLVYLSDLTRRVASMAHLRYHA